MVFWTSLLHSSTLSPSLLARRTQLYVDLVMFLHFQHFRSLQLLDFQVLVVKHEANRIHRDFLSEQIKQKAHMREENVLYFKR